MELPISVMIVLFVAVVVGGMIIMFSSQILNEAQQDIESAYDVREEHILRLSSIDDEEVISLANSCILSYGGTGEEHVCFAVFAQQSTISESVYDSQLRNNYLLSSDGTGDQNPKAFLLVLDPLQSEVRIEVVS